jgi:hypothetical protein
VDEFLNKSQKVDLPYISSEILPSTWMIINVKLGITDFFCRFSPLTYNLNHLLHRWSSSPLVYPVPAYSHTMFLTRLHGY